MAEPGDEEEQAWATLTAASPLLAAREFLANARAIGEPGAPSMVEGQALQQAHARMASAAALVSIAESLHDLSRGVTADRRRAQDVSRSLDVLAKELTKIRTGRR